MRGIAEILILDLFKGVLWLEMNIECDFWMGKLSMIKLVDPFLDHDYSF